MTAASRDAAVMLGLQALLQPLTDAPGTLIQLPPSGPDEAWALTYTQGPTDPAGRWGQGVLVLQCRGPRGNPLAVHDLAQPLVQALTALRAVALEAGVSISKTDHRGSTTYLDSNSRTVRADSFPLDLDYQA